MSTCDGLSEFVDEDLSAFNNVLYRVHRCFQDALTKQVRSEEEHQKLIDRAFFFEESGLDMIASKFRDYYHLHSFPAKSSSGVLTPAQLASWDSFHMPPCNLKTSPPLNYLREVLPSSDFQPHVWTPEYRQVLEETPAPKRNCSSKKNKAQSPSASSKIEVEEVPPPSKKAKFTRSSKNIKVTTTEPESVSEAEEAVDPHANEEETKNYDSGESEVDQLCSSPVVPLAHLK
ncbi:hypothetical protein E1B28_008443 [Marasmius oreades]|uniref:Uncharacterized protein n=1 Tax=Marasmius oreades TaxID=181124 RepID=A0A9P7RZ36_9AGAR|nr:uncharacterized protein E1B28_008443 [Marasmius oreades]KAG7092062.1 hypothetical protein E1B28_008443 [Marasmius oreades]